MTNSTQSSSVYASDHSAAVLSTHNWRTAQNSLPHLLTYLSSLPTSPKILDIGCGPGSITISLAKLLPKAHITGVEYTSAPLITARTLASSESISNVTFQEGDIHALDFQDESFDVVNAHQVLQHIRDPIQGLKEMRRVCKKGGLIAVRESSQMSWYPQSLPFSRWRDLYLSVAKINGGDPDPGGKLHVWAKEAGFKDKEMECSTGSWCFHTKEERAYWGSAFAERVLPGTQWGGIAVENGLATKEELDEISRAWKGWVKDEDGWFGVLHGQVICQKG